jgi:hypothetical protein
VRYRVLDGTFDGTTLSFWLSPMDLWTDWCSLQTPYPFQLGGVKGYRCVPADASDQNTDLGKLSLCASAFDSGGTSGSVVFGDREPPPAATDPSAFYPPLGSFDPLWYEALIEAPFNGFPYTLLDLDIRDGRLTASIGPGELWHDWCALQPKSQPPSTYDGYVCGAVFKPQIDTSQATDPPDMRVLCDGDNGHGGTYAKICNCDLVSCRANLDAYRWRLDLELKDGAYEGEFAAASGDIGGVWAPGVRLRRVQ